jgi:asparagine synthase (glutamine-hydrolysing)
MCGIAGFVAMTLPDDQSNAAIRAMTAAIAHRGPDDDGHWYDPEAGIALGHRRLAIVDLSPAGHQPMTSSSGRFITVFNGEIYNFEELRRELDASGFAPAWRGHSDTEVLLATFERWGLETALSKLNGMFAIAVWDRANHTLSLARDRMGEKPLYFGRVGKGIAFASELKALTGLPGFVRSLDREALTGFLSRGFVGAPSSIWQGINKLPPASYVTINSAGVVGEVRRYWDIAAVARAGVARPFADRPELTDRLETLLRDAVKLRMVSDVPLGAFLSGGIDSSTIVALMQRNAAKRIQTFSIGFKEQGYDEAVYARAVAAHLGTEHTELYVSPKDMLDLVPRVPEIWDEPFADSSQLPMQLVSALTRKHVTVALSGDGGDELFGGYNRYVVAPRLWMLASRLPRQVRGLVSSMLKRSATAHALSAVVQRLPARNRIGALADRLPRVAHVFDATSSSDYYARFQQQIFDADRLVLGSRERGKADAAAHFEDFRNTMMLSDATGYLPDDILTKVDRASMSVALEARVPFLDHRVVEFAWSVPMSAKIRNGVGKHIVREVLNRYVPVTLFDRPKAGFAIPLDNWLRGPLATWADDLLLSDRIRDDAVLDAAPIRAMWLEHRSGARSHAHALWNVLMFQSWWDHNRSGISVSNLNIERRADPIGNAA